MVQIIPAILATTEEDFERDLTRYNQANSLENGWVHIDFMDNKFVPNKSIIPPQVAKYPTDLQKEAHLMVLYPLEWIDGLVEAGFKRIIFHIESEDDIKKVIEEIKSKGLEVGLAINMETPLERLTPFLDQIDVILIMSIKPGFQGQLFILESLERIKECSRLRSNNNMHFLIGVDGAVSDQNVKDLVDSGVDNLIIGSFLLEGDIEENLEKIWEVLNG